MPITLWSERGSEQPTRSNQTFRYHNTSFLLPTLRLQNFGSCHAPITAHNTGGGGVPKAAAFPISHMHMVFPLLNLFEPGPVIYGPLVLNVYVNVSFGRSRSGLGMYSVNPSKVQKALSSGIKKDRPPWPLLYQKQSFQQWLMAMLQEGARTATYKLQYLRELVYDDLQIVLTYISGDSQ